MKQFEARLEAMLARRDELNALMSTGEGDMVRLATEYSELEPVCAVIESWKSLSAQILEVSQLVEQSSDDREMRDLAEVEYRDLKAQLPGIEKELQHALLPKDEADARGVILEIRPGTGGDEATLFASDLLRMYRRYSELQKWSFEVMSSSETDVGGLREAVCSISGRGVYAKLKFESGVHRVQRVPVTETQGRIHTSAATVAILPEAEEVDVEIRDVDLRIDVFRAQGAGGQHVNTTDSAVRITHLPTGTVVSQQDEKSQHKNKAKALRVLRARIYEAERRQLNAERAAERKGQVGSGDRSERIRTYNFPQNRVSDHRINLTLYNLDSVIVGDALGDVIAELVADDETQRLLALSDDG